MTLPLSKAAFWDTDMAKMDEISHAAFIITRVFQYGLLDDIRAVLKRYSPIEIKKAFQSQRGIDPKAISLAAVLLEIDEVHLQFQSKEFLNVYPVDDF